MLLIKSKKLYICKTESMLNSFFFINRLINKTYNFSSEQINLSNEYFSLRHGLINLQSTRGACLPSPMMIDVTDMIKQLFYNYLTQYCPRIVCICTFSGDCTPSCAKGVYTKYFIGEKG